jgi:hypothetical protein
MENKAEQVLEKEKKYFRINDILVVEEKKTMVCIYLSYGKNDRHLLTSRGNWKSAVKTARLLNRMYRMGYDDAYDVYANDRY